MDLKSSILSHLPFALAMVRNGNGNHNNSDGRVKMNTQRILEGLIIAGITGGITLYGVQQRLDAQMAEIKTQMSRLETRMAEDRAEAAARARDALERDRRIEDRVDAIHRPAVGLRP